MEIHRQTSSDISSQVFSTQNPQKSNLLTSENQQKVIQTDQSLQYQQTVDLRKGKQNSQSNRYEEQIQELRKQIKHLRQNLIMQQQKECKLIQQLEGSVSICAKYYQQYLDQSQNKIRVLQSNAKIQKQKIQTYLYLNMKKNERILNLQQKEKLLMNNIEKLQKIIKQIGQQKGIQTYKLLQSIGYEGQIQLLRQKLTIKQKKECKLLQKIKLLENNVNVLNDKLKDNVVQTQRKMQILQQQAQKNIQNHQNTNKELCERIQNLIQKEKQLQSKTQLLQKKLNNSNNQSGKYKQRQQWAEDKLSFSSKCSSIHHIEQLQSLMITFQQIKLQLQRPLARYCKTCEMMRNKIKEYKSNGQSWLSNSFQNSQIKRPERMGLSEQEKKKIEKLEQSEKIMRK